MFGLLYETVAAYLGRDIAGSMLTSCPDADADGFRDCVTIAGCLLSIIRKRRFLNRRRSERWNSIIRAAGALTVQGVIVTVHSHRSREGTLFDDGARTTSGNS